MNCSSISRQRERSASDLGNYTIGNPRWNGLSDDAGGFTHGLVSSVSVRELLTVPVA
jgi:hypothetical protein